MAFVQEGATLSIHSTTPEETKCAGLFCDKQRVHEITTHSHGCGCYHMLGRRSNITFDHWMDITKGAMNIVMEHF
eukprot:1417333-Ditylum_brightwellii.AAC.1